MDATVAGEAFAVQARDCKAPSHLRLAVARAALAISVAALPCRPRPNPVPPVLLAPALCVMVPSVLPTSDPVDDRRPRSWKNLRSFILSPR